MASWWAAQAGHWETVAHYWLIGGYMISIHTPTLIVAGNRDVADAGHMVNMEQPAEFDLTVLTFLHSQ
jgi:pimeloyl-ACP methyl ester carboxylesterase